MNFNERIKKSFAYDDDDISLDLGASGQDLAELRKNLLEPKDSNEYQVAKQILIGSVSNLQKVPRDSEFMSSLERVHADDGEFNELKDYFKKGELLAESIIKNKEKMALKTAKNMKAAGTIANAVVSGMEEPAKSFYEGLFKVLTQMKLDATKIQMLNDDETGFNITKDIDKATGTKDTLNNIKDENGKKLVEDDPSAESSSESSSSGVEVSDADLNIQVTDEASARKLGEALAKKMHGDKFDQAIFDDVFQHGIDTVGDDPNTLAAYLRNVYKGATEMSFGDRILKAFSRG